MYKKLFLLLFIIASFYSSAQTTALPTTKEDSLSKQNFVNAVVEMVKDTAKVNEIIFTKETLLASLTEQEKSVMTDRGLREVDLMIMKGKESAYVMASQFKACKNTSLQSYEFGDVGADDNNRAYYYVALSIKCDGVIKSLTLSCIKLNNKLYLVKVLES